MVSRIAATLLGVSLAWALPHNKRAVDNTQPSGKNPVALAFGAEYLGPQTSNNTCVIRDLGFTGQISGKWYSIFGDTSYCTPGVTDALSLEATAGGFHGMVRDSVAAMTDNVLNLHDVNLNSERPMAYPKQFIPYNHSWGESADTGFGGTSLCETNGTTGEGLVFYVVVSHFLVTPC